MGKRKRPGRHQLKVSGVVDSGDFIRPERKPLQIPLWWFTSVLGLFLIPPAGILTQTFFTCLSRETVSHRFWATEEFWFFTLGAILWKICFFFLPKPFRIYVFGHELTHAVWVWAMGGRVSSFKIQENGGYILTDTHNVWVALAPYFYPIYSILLIVIYGFVCLFTDPVPYHKLFFALLGFTWSFHITFTVWMIPKGQTDLTHYGTFFSLVLIYLMNLLVLSILLLLAAPNLSFMQFGAELFNDTVNFCSWVWHFCND